MAQMPEIYGSQKSNAYRGVEMNPAELRRLAVNQRLIGHNRDFIADALEWAADEIERLNDEVDLQVRNIITLLTGGLK